MHIVLLNDDALPTASGGAAVVVDRLHRAYAKEGHEVTLITTHQDSCDVRKSSDEAGHIVSLPISYSLKGRHRMCVHNPEAHRQVEDVLKECKPDAVHVHNVHAYLSYESLLLARAHTDRIIMTAHDTYLVSFGRVKENKKLSVKDHIAIAGRKYSPMRNRKIKRILKETGTKVVAISQALRSFLEINGIDVTTVIYNGVEVKDTPNHVSVEELEKTHHLEGPVILFGGRISGDKGIDAVLKAFAIVKSQIPDAKLVIAGDRKRAEKYTKDLEGVITLGHLSQEEMRLAYEAATVVTTPSIYLDPFNLMNIEAMAAGKPVVGTCFGGTPEIVVNNETGLIVDPRDTENFSAALLSILKDPQKAEQWGENGRKRVSENFSLNTQVNAYLELLRS